MSRIFCQSLCQGRPTLSLASASRSVASITQSTPYLTSQSRRLSTRPAAANKPSRSPVSRAPSTPPTLSAEDLAGSAYAVRRTSYVQLPVYRRFMSGGTRQVVLIKKVDGDRRKLLEDLVEGLGIERDNIRINPTTQHLELKGDVYERTRSWLLERRF